uniref:Putative tick 18.3 kDa family protein n=1 Tax=Rhipicephalus pulchellus TaxID=72859 RepID=L7MBR5_RHIPC
MKLLVFIVLALATVIGTSGQDWYAAEYSSPEYISAAANRDVKARCYYIHWEGWRFRYVFHKNGTPCRYSYWSGKIGYCLEGRCTLESVPVQIPCDGINRNPGYATSCHYTCTMGQRSFNMSYKSNTLCLPINSSGRRAGPPGFCTQGTCKPFYNPTPAQDRLLHPAQLLQCEEKEHTGRNILTGCYHYCQKNGSWFTGYYDSKPSSGCNLPNPTPEQPLGWCCRGDCIKKHSCQQ